MDTDVGWEGLAWSLSFKLYHLSVSLRSGLCRPNEILLNQTLYLSQHKERLDLSLWRILVGLSVYAVLYYWSLTQEGTIFPVTMVVCIFTWTFSPPRSLKQIFCLLMKNCLGYFKQKGDQPLTLASGSCLISAIYHEIKVLVNVYLFIYVSTVTLEVINRIESLLSSRINYRMVFSSLFPSSVVLR